MHDGRTYKENEDKMTEHFVHGFFRQGPNQTIVHDILKKYQKIYKNDDQRFTKFLLYEIVSMICDEKDGSPRKTVTSILEKEYRSPSLLFDHTVFTHIKQMLEEETKFLDNPIVVEDGVVECRKCKSLKTISFAKQTRGSDEGTSVFVTCVMCHHKFRL